MNQIGGNVMADNTGAGIGMGLIAGILLVLAISVGIVIANGGQGDTKP